LEIEIFPHGLKKRVPDNSGKPAQNLRSMDKTWGVSIKTVPLPDYFCGALKIQEAVYF
jgi:hypothetical protein